MLGLDRSNNLIELAKTRNQNFQVFSADTLKLPLRSDSFDFVLSIAVLHHLSNEYIINKI
jgi:ubiquinone/menaquinone biosynthesis C-methylase UbiE